MQYNAQNSTTGAGRKISLMGNLPIKEHILDTTEGGYVRLSEESEMYVISLDLDQCFREQNQLNGLLTKFIANILEVTEREATYIIVDALHEPNSIYELGMALNIVCCGDEIKTCELCFGIIADGSEFGTTIANCKLHETEADMLVEYMANIKESILSGRCELVGRI